MKSLLWQNRIGILLVLFLTLRLIFIIRFPPFNDESIYVRFGLLMTQNPAFTWASIHYFSKQPLAFWIFGVGSQIFGSPFIGARLMVLLISTVSFYFFHDLLKRIASPVSGTIALILFTLCPVFILFQSLALMEGLELTLFVVLLWAMTRYRARRSVWDIAWAVLAVAAAMWIKSTAAVLLVITLGFLIDDQWVHGAWSRLALFVGGIGVLMIPLLLQPESIKLFTGPQQYTFARAELLTIPVLTWGRNVAYTAGSLLLYLSPVYALAFLPSKSMDKHTRKPLWIWFFLTLGATVILGKMFTTRYFILSVIPLTVLLADQLSSSKPLVRIIALGIPAIAALILLVNPPTFFSLFPKRLFDGERNYALGATSGYAAVDAGNYLSTRPAPIIVGVPDVPGNPGDYILATFFNSRDILAVIMNSPDDLLPIAPAIRKYPTYFVARNGVVPAFLQSRLTKEKIFPSSGGDFVELFMIK